MNRSNEPIRFRKWFGSIISQPTRTDVFQTASAIILSPHQTPLDMDYFPITSTSAQIVSGVPSVGACKLFMKNRNRPTRSVTGILYTIGKRGYVDEFNRLIKDWSSCYNNYNISSTLQLLLPSSRWPTGYDGRKRLRTRKSGCLSLLTSCCRHF